MYYVYRHIRKDNNEVFYIGKGTIDPNYAEYEWLYRRAHEERGRSQFWRNIVRKTDYEVEIIFESEDEQFILDKEKEFIELYGRRQFGNGTLVNLTEGGEGMSGLTHSEETLNKHYRGKNNPMYGRKFSEEHRRNISEGLKRSGASKGERNPMYGSARFGEENPMYGKTQSDETKRLISIAMTYPLKVTEPDGSVLNFECVYDFKVYYKWMKCIDNIYHDKRGGKPVNRGRFKGFKVERLIND